MLYERECTQSVFSFLTRKQKHLTAGKRELKINQTWTPNGVWVMMPRIWTRLLKAIIH